MRVMLFPVTKSLEAPSNFISSVCFGSTGCPKCLVSSVLPLEKSSRTLLPLVDSVDTHCALLSGGRYEENFDTFHVFFLFHIISA